MGKNYTSREILTQAFINVAMQIEIVKALSSSPDISLKSFYDNFCTNIGLEIEEGKNVAFTPGVVLGATYILCVIALKESQDNKNFLINMQKKK